VPVGTAVHDRTLRLCESLNYREWSGYFAVSAYEAHHHHEYNAIRNAAALIDISPLYKYQITGPDAGRLADRIVTRDMGRVAVGQIAYVVWCDDRGKVVDDGTISRLDEDRYRWTAADPSLRWILGNGEGLRAEVEDVSRSVAALALQGPTSGRLLARMIGGEISALRYFRVMRASIGGVAVEISRNGYTGDLGYEIWVPWNEAGRVWDALMEEGRPFGIRAAGMLALDVARIEAGLLLIEIDYISARRAIIEDQKSSPFELGLGRLVHLDKQPFIGRAALAEEARRGPARRLVGLEVNWSDVERIHGRIGLPPTAPARASREAVPVYRGGEQIGKATSTTWSPVLKKMIALATVRSEHADPGTDLQFEITVEATRYKAGAHVVPLPFFNPPRKTEHPLAG
jgi:aminomethyltransferase